MPHTIAPLATVTDKEPIAQRRSCAIESMGGGIYIYVALEAAAQMMLKAKAGTKHIILFADAADSEEPGDYKELVDKCEKAGITVSVIGLGTDRDKDAELAQGHRQARRRPGFLHATSRRSFLVFCPGHVRGGPQHVPGRADADQDDGGPDQP